MMSFWALKIRWLAVVCAIAALAVTAAAPAGAYPTPDDPVAAGASKPTPHRAHGGKGKKTKKKTSEVRRSTAPGWQGEHPPGQQPQ
jgi:hypothetical protein